MESIMTSATFGIRLKNIRSPGLFISCSWLQALEARNVTITLSPFLYLAPSALKRVLWPILLGRCPRLLYFAPLALGSLSDGLLRSIHLAGLDRRVSLLDLELQEHSS